MADLFHLAEEIRKCTACPLWKKRTLAVPGEGTKNAKVMFVGKAPSVEDDRIGLPFVDKSGKFSGLKKKDAFITHCVKCHPPNNRKPSMKELKTCKELWLEKQIDVIKPKIIVILDSVALKLLLNKTNIQELYGKIVTKNKQKFFILHPLSVLN